MAVGCIRLCACRARAAMLGKSNTVVAGRSRPNALHRALSASCQLLVHASTLHEAFSVCHQLLVHARACPDCMDQPG